MLTKLTPEELNVASCCAEMGLTWKQAVLEAGQAEGRGVPRAGKMPVRLPVIPIPSRQGSGSAKPGGGWKPEALG